MYKVTQTKQYNMQDYFIHGPGKCDLNIKAYFNFHKQIMQCTTLINDKTNMIISKYREKYFRIPSDLHDLNKN